MTDHYIFKAGSQAQVIRQFHRHEFRLNCGADNCNKLADVLLEVKEPVYNTSYNILMCNDHMAKLFKEVV